MAELKKRILVVDDDQRLRELVVRYFTEQGFEARAVADAAGMDRQLARERYDLVVLDLMLPGEDGLSICRRLRGDKAPAAAARADQSRMSLLCASVLFRPLQNSSSRDRAANTCTASPPPRTLRS